MLDPLPDFDPDLLLGVLRDRYPEVAASGWTALRFVPAGEDSWSFRLGPFWISVRRDQSGHDPRCYAAARELRTRPGLEWIVAPLAARGGRAVETIGGRPLVLYPYLNLDPAAAAAADRRPAVVARVEALHRQAPPLELPRETFEAPHERALADAMVRALAAGRTAGPYSERLRAIVAAKRGAIEALVGQAGRLRALCLATDPREFVLTHGDVSPSNFPLLGGEVVGLDFGGLAMAPPERDWAALRRSFGGPRRGRAPIARYYDLEWRLRELAEYFSWFASVQADSRDSQAKWARMMRWLPDRT